MNHSAAATPASATSIYRKNKAMREFESEGGSCMSIDDIESSLDPNQQIRANSPSSEKSVFSTATFVPGSST